MATWQHPTSGEVLVMDDVTLVPSADRTAGGNGTGVALGDKTCARVLIDCTAKSGTIALAVTIETSPDNSTWTAVGAASSTITDVSQVRLLRGVLDRYIRATWTLTGSSPHATFSVTAEVV